MSTEEVVAALPDPTAEDVGEASTTPQRSSGTARYRCSICLRSLIEQCPSVEVARGLSAGDDEPLWPTTASAVRTTKGSSTETGLDRIGARERTRTAELRSASRANNTAGASFRFITPSPVRCR